MGNRAVITFDEKASPESIGIYLHWNGGPESVLAFLEAANSFGVRQGCDYELARVVQIIANYFGGTCSVGVGKLKELDCDNHDNGLYVVSRSGGTITIKQDGKLLDLEQIKKHMYWELNKDGKPALLADILECNNDRFLKKETA